MRRYLPLALLASALLLLALALWLGQEPERFKQVNPPLIGRRVARIEGHKGLRDVAARHGLTVGVAVHPPRLEDERFAATVAQEFSSVTPEVVMKFEVIHPCPPPALTEPGSARYNPAVAAWVAADETDDCDGSEATEWNWQPMDAIVDWAEANGIGVYGHTFAWHQQNPRWLTDTGLTPAERAWILEQHIETIIHRYCQRPVYAYDVVNEAITPDGSLLPLGPWYDLPNYPALPFRIARAALNDCHADPARVLLFYNDWGIEYGRSADFELFIAEPGEYNKSDAVYRRLAALLAGDDPAPIDGLGMQTHLQLGGPRPYPHDTAAMVAQMRRFAALGLAIRITELDMPLYGDDPARLLDEQAAQFGGVAAACRRVPACTGLTTWGLQDATSWRGEQHLPLLFSNDGCGPTFCPKAGYHALRMALR